MVIRIFNKYKVTAFVVIAMLLLGGCVSVPFDYPRTETTAMEPRDDSYLAAFAREWEEIGDDKSGFYFLDEGNDALGARLRLIEFAEHTIDAQYFLMKSDEAGSLFMGKLLRAADRGVRVRLLLDDIFTTVKDTELALLDRHKNIEIRLYNPIARRGLRHLNLLADFQRANRRMHNKSFVADNLVGIVGGRNIADEYFQIGTTSEFLDLDVLCVGPVVRDVSSAFDEFWNDEFAVPMEAYQKKVDYEELDAARRDIEQKINSPDSIYRRAVESKLVGEIVDRKLPFTAHAYVVTDSPEKLRNARGDEFQNLVNRARELLVEVEEEVIALTPYLIPDDRGMEMVKRVAGRGVRVVIITNSLASTNHIPVHAAYARYRKHLIDAGVELYEVRSDAGRSSTSSTTEESPDKTVLHTKAIIFDRRLLLVGSLNLDPRSREINTELGMVIESDEIAAWVEEAIDQDLSTTAWRVTLNENRQLRWQTTDDGRETVLKSEPQSSTWRRFKAFLSRILPEQQL